VSTVETPRPQRPPPSWIAATLLAANLGLACLVAWAVYSFGSIGFAVGYMRGERLFAHATSVVSASKGEEQELDLVVANLDDRPVRILGGLSSCSCLVPLGLPALLPANDRSTIRIMFRPQGRSGRFAQRLRLFTDHPDQRQLDVWVECDVVGTAASGKKQPTSRGI
jgi:hypothetical protein